MTLNLFFYPPNRLHPMSRTFLTDRALTFDPEKKRNYSPRQIHKYTALEMKRKMSNKLNWSLRPCEIETLAFLNLQTGSGYLTAVAPLVRLSSGSGCSATCCLCGATHGSPPTGWISADPERPQTESDGCKRCRPRPRRSSGRGGSRSWCGWACCSWPELKRPKKEF